MIQTLAYIGKLLVHPTGVQSWDQFVTRADIGPIPGEVVLLAGVTYIGTGIVLMYWVAQRDAAMTALHTLSAAHR